jgi:hypothetical protein
MIHLSSVTKKDAGATEVHSGAPPDSERAKQPPLPEAPYEPYAKKPGVAVPYKPYEKPAAAEGPYKPYAKKPRAEAPYEPYKGM